MFVIVHGSGGFSRAAKSCGQRVSIILDRSSPDSQSIIESTDTVTEALLAINMICVGLVVIVGSGGAEGVGRRLEFVADD